MDATDLFGDASDISDDEGDAQAAAPSKPAISDDEDDVRRGSDYEDDQHEPRAVIQVGWGGAGRAWWGCGNCGVEVDGGSGGGG